MGQGGLREVVEVLRDRSEERAERAADMRSSAWLMSREIRRLADAVDAEDWMAVEISASNLEKLAAEFDALDGAR